VDRIKKRLFGWRSKKNSFGGRLVLLKSVLSSLHVYVISFFKASLGIISTLEFIFINFFLGRCEDHRKISWVAWNNICDSKEFGELGVRRLREFNISLLGKWCWRLLVDRGSLWYRVLVARYGEEYGRLVVGGQSVSSWWREVASIRDGLRRMWCARLVMGLIRCVGWIYGWVRRLCVCSLVVFMT